MSDDAEHQVPASATPPDTRLADAPHGSAGDNPSHGNPQSDGAPHHPDGSRLQAPVLEHLGQKLRSAYNEVAEKPAYLGDPTLPPEVEHQLVRLGDSVRASETGLHAVEEALLGTTPKQPDESSDDE